VRAPSGIGSAGYAAGASEALLESAWSWLTMSRRFVEGSIGVLPLMALEPALDVDEAVLPR
jgi:hypothetical protein